MKNEKQKVNNLTREKEIENVKKIEQQFKAWFGENFSLRPLMVIDAYPEDKIYEYQNGDKLKIRRAVIVGQDIISPEERYQGGIPIKAYPRSQFGCVVRLLTGFSTKYKNLHQLELILPKLIGQKYIGHYRLIKYLNWFEGKRRTLWYANIYRMFPHIDYYNDALSEKEIREKEDLTKQIFKIYQSHPKSLYEIKAKR